MERQLVKASKFLSLVLRHDPARIGLQLDEHGWAGIDDLLLRMEQSSVPLTRQVLEEIVRTNDKRRFALNAEGTKIRALQGHSIEVNLNLTAVEPPRVLFHGTAEGNLPSILEQGLMKGRRHHVHLSLDEQTALRVGQRHGRPVVLQVQAQRMFASGHEFYRTENGVWLTAHVPASFLERLGKK